MENSIFTIKHNTLQKYNGNEENVIVPNGVNVISWNAFSNCKSIKSILIPEGVEGIGANCFENCENLQEITIPQSLLSIGSSAFSNCKNLKKVSFGENLKKIERLTFANCESLQEIEINSDSIKIEPLAFLNCKNLEKITLTNCQNIEVTKWNAFDGCKKISTEFFESFKNVKTNDDDVGQEIFEKIEVKDSMILSKDRLLRIFDTEIEDFTVPDFIKSMKEDVFPQNVKEIDFPKNFLIERKACTYASNEATNEVSNKIDIMVSKEKKITEIKNSGIKGLLLALSEEFGNFSFSSITDYSIFEKDYLGKYGFEDKKEAPKDIDICMQCKSRVILLNLDLDISSQQEKIQNFMQVFADFSKTTDEIVEEIKKSNFRLSEKIGFTIDGTETAEITLFTRVFFADDFKFKNVKSLEVAQILPEEEAIEECNKRLYSHHWWGRSPKENYEIENITFASCCQTILYNSIVGLNGIKEIVIPSSVKNVKEDAIENCENLEKVVFSDGVEHIDKNIFVGCNKLKDIYLPKTLKDSDFILNFNDSYYYGIQNKEFNIFAPKEIIRELNPNYSEYRDSLPYFLGYSSNLMQRLESELSIKFNFIEI